MTTTESSYSSRQVVPGSVDLPIASWPATTKDESVDALSVASKIVDTFNNLLTKSDHKAIASLFLENGYWRDHLGLTWDFHTLKGREKITSFLDKGHHLANIEIDQQFSEKKVGAEFADFRADGSVSGIRVYLRINSKHGSGRGLAQLVQTGGEWKIWTLYTSVQGLNDHPEPFGSLRANGATHGLHIGRKNWLERRQAEINFESSDPDVLIIGAGQAGLSAHARLKMLQVPTLIIDMNDNVGDNWRKRYHHLVLHDPIWYDHLPYMNFPDFWPIFTPKDKLADFLKAYAEFLELNVWTSTSLESSTWDDEKKHWVVVLKRKKKDGSVEVRELRPKHIVQATGHSGKRNFPEFKGMKLFQGDVLCHSSDFQGAKKNTKGKKAVVIGGCNSAMDIAQDYYENGYDVTLVQRSSTTVIGNKTVMDHFLGPLYCEGGPPVDEGDLIAWSRPSELFKALHADINEISETNEKDILEGLAKAGLKTDRGPMNCGMWMKYLQRGGGYYIDVGTTQLIIDGKIKVKHGFGISEILHKGVKLEDGTELEADEIVCATGYGNMRTSTEAIFGEKVASKTSDVWGFDEEGEIKVMWRPSGHPGFWYHGGNLAICRYFSRFLAVQIKAQLEGLYKPSQA